MYTLEVAWLRRDVSKSLLDTLTPEDRARMFPSTIHGKLMYNLDKSLSTFFNPEYRHVELAFRNKTDDTLYSTGITNSQSLFWIADKLYTKDWEVYQFGQIPQENVIRMMEFCKSEVRRSENMKRQGGKGITINHTSELRAATPFPSPPDPNHYFCSEYVITVFQHVGYLMCVEPSAIPPSDTYFLIRSSFYNTLVLKGAGYTTEEITARYKQRKKTNIEIPWTTRVENYYDAL